MTARREVWMPGRVHTEIQFGAADTAGAFCLRVDDPPAGWSLPAHLQLDIAETIHVVAGQFELTVDGERRLLGAGQTGHVPADVVHASANIGDRPGHRIVILSRAGIEDFFLEAGAPAPSDVDPKAALRSALSDGWRLID